MAVRKFLAAQLSNAAKAVENDRTKEKVNASLLTARVLLANAIMPKHVKQPIKR